MAFCGSTCEYSCEDCNDLSDCTGLCSMSCSGLCGGNCTGTCLESCSGTCGDVCSNNCTSSCYGSCIGSCSGDCYNTCLSCSALGNCSDTCKSCSALGDCTGTCSTTCLSTCLSTCLATCADDCTGGAYMTRPSNFTGFSGVSSGQPITNLTASDWNAFNQRLIAFAWYKGEKRTIGTFTTVSSGDNFTAAIYNRTVQGLSVLSSYITTTMPTNKSSGQDVYASYIQALKTALNSIT